MIMIKDCLKEVPAGGQLVLQSGRPATPHQHGMGQEGAHSGLTDSLYEIGDVRRRRERPKVSIL